MYTVIIKNKIRKFSLEEKILKLKKRNYKNAEKILKKSKQEIKYLSNDFLMDRKICLSIKCNKIIAALETDPEKRGKEMYSIGFSYSLLGKSRTAKKYYISAAKNGNIRAVNALGVISVNEGKYDLALKFLEHAVKLKYNPSLNSLGFLYFKMKKYDLSEKYYKESIESEPKDFGEKFYKSEAMCNLGILYEKQGMDEPAVQYYKMGIEYNKHPRSMVHLGKFYQSKEKLDLAKKYYQMAINEDYKPAEYLLKRLKNKTLNIKMHI